MKAKEPKCFIYVDTHALCFPWRLTTFSSPLQIFESLPRSKGGHEAEVQRDLPLAVSHKLKTLSAHPSEMFCLSTLTTALCANWSPQTADPQERSCLRLRSHRPLPVAKGLTEPISMSSLKFVKNTELNMA